MNTGKPLYESKIFWVNILATITALLDMAGALNIPAEYVTIGAAVVAAANVILRVWFTDQPIKL